MSSKPSNNLPGVSGDLNTRKASVGIDFANPYREMIENKLKEYEQLTGIRLSFQEAVKLSVAYFFPVSDYEPQTEIFVEEFLGNPHKDKNPAELDKIDPDKLKTKYAGRQKQFRTDKLSEEEVSDKYVELRDKTEQIAKESASRTRVNFGGNK
jgi:hypothetical protein